MFGSGFVVHDEADPKWLEVFEYEAATAGFEPRHLDDVRDRSEEFTEGRALQHRHPEDVPPGSHVRRRRLRRAGWNDVGASRTRGRRARGAVRALEAPDRGRRRLGHSDAARRALRRADVAVGRVFTYIVKGTQPRRTRLHNCRGDRLDARGFVYLPHSLLTTIRLRLTGRRPALPWLGYRAIRRLDTAHRAATGRCWSSVPARRPSGSLAAAPPWSRSRPTSAGSGQSSEQLRQ